jgi:hypothetical protein
VHEFLSARAVESHKRPATSRPVNGIRLRKFGIFAIKVAEFHGTFLQARYGEVAVIARLSKRIDDE